MKIYHWAAGLALLGGVILERSLGDETAVVTQKNVNVRGQPSLYSEVIAHLKQGDKVTILEEVTPAKPKPGDPDKWARIKIPDDTHVWVFASYVKDNAIAVPKLNLRGGPGENFSVLGRMQKGEAIKPIRTLQDWIEIEAPTNATAFVAFEVLKRESPSTTETTTTNAVALPEINVPKPVQTQAPPAELPKTEPAPPSVPEKEQAKLVKSIEEPASKPAESNVEKTTTVTTNAVADLKSSIPSVEPKKIDPKVAQTIVENESKPLATKTIAEDAGPALPKDATKASDSTPTPRPVQTAQAAPIQSTLVPPPSAAVAVVPDLKPKEIGEIPQAEKAEEPAVIKRIVRREGIVRNALSIQAPSPFELVNPETHKSMDYLHGEKSGITVKHFKGQRVIVTGEEGIDPRWPNTPVLEIETIDSAP